MKQRLTTNNNDISIICRPFFLNVQHIMSIALIGILVSSCSIKDDISGCDDSNNQEFQGNTYLTVQVQTQDEEESTTRAASSLPDGPGTDGGSDGEGNELGYENEYKVDNLTLLVFKQNGEETNIGKSDDANNIILKTFYFSNFVEEASKDTKNKYYKASEKYKIDATLVKNGFEYIIIANAGDVGSNYIGKNVVKVADDILKEQWFVNETPGVPGAPVETDAGKSGEPKCNTFLMTTDNQIYSYKSGDNDGTGTENDPKVLFGKIKRLAARIDFMVDAPKKDKLANDFESVTINGTTYSGYVYDAVDKDGNAAGKFLLTHVLPFNCQKEGTYFLKHIFSPNWELNAVDGISHLTEYSKLEKEVWVTDTYNGEKTRFKYSTNWVLDPWCTYKTTDGTYTTTDGKTKSCKNYVSHIDNHSASQYTNYLAKSVTASADLINNTWDYGWDQYKIREVENYIKDDNGKCYIVTYTNENTVIYKNSYDYATGVVFRGLYFTNEEWNNGNPTTEGKDMAYKYYLRHSDPYDIFNKTGNPDEEAINDMVIDKSKITDEKGTSLETYKNVSTLKNTMLYGTVRNNIYRVSISKIIAPEKTEEGLTIIPKIQVRKWATYTHDEITM